METDFSFGHWLEKQRKALDLTREEFAQKVGCSTSALRKIESDQRRPSRQLAELIARILEISPDERESFIQIARGDLSIERMNSSHPNPELNLVRPQKIFSSNIPTPPTPLIGRETELASIHQMLSDPQCRMLTVTGIGGIGKTRLAIEVANTLKENFKDGVGFVALAGLTSPDFLVSAIVDALEITLAGSQDVKKQLLNALQGKELLLVLDNAENILPDVGLFSEILESVSSLKLLVTSRVQLNIQWEWVFELRGLPVPSSDKDEQLKLFDSVALFMQRAQQVKTNLKFDSNDIESIARVCQMVEGCPLAIELAAPWVKVLSIQEICEEIEKHLDILESSAHDLPERHRSIRTTFNYSWNLLSEDEKRTLSRLSTFRGSFTREAAEHVTGTSLLLLSTLKTKSWLQRHSNGRFHLHELIRQYAAEKLQADVEDELLTKVDFCNYYAAQLEKWEDRIKSPQSVEVLVEMGNEIDNIRQAWEWMVLYKQPANISRSQFSLYWFHEMHGLYQQGIMLFNHAATALRPLVKSSKDQEKKIEYLVALGQVLTLEARWLARSGELDVSSEKIKESIDILRSTMNKAALGDALRLSGNIEFIWGNYERAAELLEESVVLCRETSHQWGLASSLIVLGNLLQFQGDYERSFQVCTEAVEVSRVMGEPRMLAGSLFYKADVTQSLGLFDEAETLLQESLAISRSIQDRWSIACALQILGSIATNKKEAENAVERLHLSLQIFNEMGERARIVSSMIELGNALLLQNNLQEAKLYFTETVKMAAEDQLLPAIVEALIGVATIQVQEKEIESAYELTFYVLNHPATYPLIKERADQLCSDLESQITSGKLGEIQALTQNKTIDEITDQVLKLS